MIACDCPYVFLVLINYDILILFIDIDECDTYYNGGCAHTCINEVGSYICSCENGYSLQADFRSCNG